MDGAQDGGASGPHIYERTRSGLSGNRYGVDRRRNIGPGGSYGGGGESTRARIVDRAAKRGAVSGVLGLSTFEWENTTYWRRCNHRPKLAITCSRWGEPVY